MEHITLYYRKGSSDKVYQASLQPEGDGFVVHFAFGRRGTALQTGTKTQTPVSYARAKSIYDKLVKEKEAKGYTPGADGTPYRHTDKAQQATGILPQLLNPITSDEAARLVIDPGWCLQEKFDGRRTLLRKEADGTVSGINRQGLVVSLPETFITAAAALPGSFLLDGEAMGDALVAFDLLELDGGDLRSLPCRERLLLLLQLVPLGGSPVHAAETACEPTHKAELLERLRVGNKEGAVFKRLAAGYTPGRPTTGGDALKLKFTETASFVVTAHNEQRSVALGLRRGSQLVPAGNVTVPPNHPLPAEGSVVEVRYLYAFPESGCIYQPTYLGEREDVAPGDCTVRQLKFKAAQAAA
jgi:bifunctional non-homologous end joining protein LigD